MCFFDTQSVPIKIGILIIIIHVIFFGNTSIYYSRYLNGLFVFSVKQASPASSSDSQKQKPDK